ncbi:hypothetical protein Btru_057522 [Bulinus truncatus]|nr:hypothetical protein Btru_057522 [Bulinus truncatus]
MKFPFGQHGFTKIGVAISTVLSWTLAFLIALTPIIYPEWLVYSSNGMCLGLPLTGSGEAGWMYSMAVFIILNFIMFILIAIGQVAIYRSLGDRKKLSIPNPSRRENDIDVAKQLFIIAVTDFLCWFPISVLGLMSIKGQIVSREMYAWLIVLVLPLNSAVNPMIYTVPMIYEKWVEFREAVLSQIKGGSSFECEAVRYKHRVNKKRGHCMPDKTVTTVLVHLGSSMVDVDRLQMRRKTVTQRCDFL